MQMSFLVFFVGSFTVLSSGAIYTYYNIVLKVDEEDFNGHGTLLQEGMFTSIMLFLVGLDVLTYMCSITNCHCDKC